MSKRNRLLSVCVLAALLIGIAVWGATRLLSDPVIDCLDSGGSWHYDIKACSHTENYRGPR